MYSVGKKVSIVGDSHLSRIRKNLFNNSLKNGKSHINVFKGATTKRLNHFIDPFLEEDKPDTVVIHIGSNDINPRNHENINAKTLCDEIIAIGSKCVMSGVKEVIISSILLKRDLKLTKLIRQLNDHLRDECAKYNFKYLSNDNY